MLKQNFLSKSHFLFYIINLNRILFLWFRLFLIRLFP